MERLGSSVKKSLSDKFRKGHHVIRGAFIQKRQLLQKAGIVCRTIDNGVNITGAADHFVDRDIGFCQNQFSVSVCGEDRIRMCLSHQREISQTVYGRFHCAVDFPGIGSSCLRNVILYDLLKVMLGRGGDRPANFS